MGNIPNRRAHCYLGLHPDEITVMEQFKQQGYATQMVGKWHLGTEPKFMPRRQLWKLLPKNRISIRFIHRKSGRLIDQRRRDWALCRERWHFITLEI